MKCRKCDTELKKYSTGDLAGIVPVYAFYCPNTACELAGFILIGNPDPQGEQK